VVIIETMKIGEFIRKKREEAKLSLRAVAKKAGISHVTLIDIEHGKKQPRVETLRRILSAMRVSWDECLKETGIANVEGTAYSEVARVPIISWIKAGEWGYVWEVFDPDDAEGWIPTDVKGPRVFALRVVGDSMEPRFKEGDIIVVDPDAQVDPGNFVIVRNQEGEVVFKQLKRYGRTWVLHSLNPKYPDIEVGRIARLKLVGKVVRKIERL